MNDVFCVLRDVDQNHQIFSSRSSFRIAVEMADAPSPNTGACRHQTPLPDLIKIDIYFDGFDQRPPRHGIGKV
jgi:hypothetical protein